IINNKVFKSSSIGAAFSFKLFTINNYLINIEVISRKLIRNIKNLKIKIMSTNKVYDRPKFKDQYDNYINGKWTPPASGKYFDVITPLDGTVMSISAQSNAQELDLAVEAAAEAFKTWVKTSATELSIILNKNADRIEQKLEYIAAVESTINGKPVRETLNADITLAID